jgi:hypothetical protein
MLKQERDRFLAEEARLQALVDALNAEKVALVGDKTRMKEAEAELQRALKELQARKAPGGGAGPAGQHPAAAPGLPPAAGGSSGDAGPHRGGRCGAGGQARRV